MRCVTPELFGIPPEHVIGSAFAESYEVDGDVPMLEFTDSQEGPSLCLLVDHDDASREVGYDAGAEKALAAAKKHDWPVVSMSNDWKRVFSFQGANAEADR